MKKMEKDTNLAIQNQKENYENIVEDLIKEKQHPFFSQSPWVDDAKPCFKSRHLDAFNYILKYLQ